MIVLHTEKVLMIIVVAAIFLFAIVVDLVLVVYDNIVHESPYEKALKIALF